MDKLIAQGFIFLGYVIFYCSRFMKEKKRMLIVDNISRLCSIAGYVLFGSLNGMEHVIYGMVRNCVGRRADGMRGLVKTVIFFTMLLLLIVMYGVSYDGLPTVMLVISGAINLTAVMFCGVFGIRLGTVMAAAFNTAAFIMIGSYASVLGEAFCIAAGVASMVRGGNEDCGKNVNIQERN